MKRRTFLKDAAIGVTALAGASLASLSAEELNPSGATNPKLPSAENAGPNIGRPVRIISIGYKDSMPLADLVEHVDEEGSRGSDLIVLPESSQGQDQASEEPLQGPTVTAMAASAKKHNTYIAVPIDRRDHDRRLNSVVLLNRSGQVVCVYDKVFPYWAEFDVHPVVNPGQSVEVHQADFGCVGIATCFDVNFPEVWRSLADKGAEVVIWPSAYSAGRSLQAHSINHHYYIVTSTHTPDCIAYDITGEQLHYDWAEDVNISRVTLDLDRGIYHENFNLEKRDKLLSEHSQDVEQEKWMKLEQWFVLKAKRPGVSARNLARQYGLEELRHYIDRSRLSIDKRRGWEFAEKVVFPNKRISELKALALESEPG
jgi:predicted amidohydrolase